MSDNAANVRQTIDAIGHEKVFRYIKEACPAEYQALGYYSFENAEKWLDLDAFMAWLSRSFQSLMKEKLPGPLAASSALTPVASRVEASNVSKKLFSGSLTPSSLLPSTPRASYHRRSSPPIEISDNSDYDITPSKEQKKRKRRNSSPTHIKQENSDCEIEIVKVKSTKATRRGGENSDSEVEVVETNRSKVKEGGSAHPPVKKHRKDSAIDKKRIQITRQFSCKKIVTLTKISTCWSVPYDDEGIVYLLDLSQDTREWEDKNGDLMSMAAIIKSVDQDAWGGGSGGHLSAKKTPVISLLDNEPCQVAEHSCQGIFHCDQLDLTLLEAIERYEPDEDDRRELFEAERDFMNLDTFSYYN